MKNSIYTYICNNSHIRIYKFEIHCFFVYIVYRDFMLLIISVLHVNNNVNNNFVIVYVYIYSVMAGQPMKFKNPQELWKHFEGYKAWILANPIKEQHWVGKDAREVDKVHYEPPTWKGFESYLFTVIGKADATSGIVDLDKYRRNVNEAYTEYGGIIRAIGAYMFQRKYAGAAVGIYNQNIIARELGLADIQETGPIQRPILEGGLELPGDEDLPDDDLLG